MTMQLVFMGRPPEDKEALLEWVMRLSRRLTGREATPEEMAASRRILGLPAAESTDRGGA